MDPTIQFLNDAIVRGGPAVLAVVFMVLYIRENLERRGQTKILLDTLPKMTVALETMRAILGNGRP